MCWDLKKRDKIKSQEGSRYIGLALFSFLPLYFFINCIGTIQRQTRQMTPKALLKMNRQQHRVYLLKGSSVNWHTVLWHIVKRHNCKLAPILVLYSTKTAKSNKNTVLQDDQFSEFIYLNCPMIVNTINMPQIDCPVPLWYGKE